VPRGTVRIVRPGDARAGGGGGSGDPLTTLGCALETNETHNDEKEKRVGVLFWGVIYSSESLGNARGKRKFHISFSGQPRCKIQPKTFSVVDFHDFQDFHEFHDEMGKQIWGSFGMGPPWCSDFENKSSNFFLL